VAQKSLIALSLLTLLAGCGSFGSSVDGRYVQGKDLVYGTMRSDGHVASVDLGGKHLTVTGTQITWREGGSLKLPDQWGNMQLAESFGSVTVYVDGRWFAKIRPG
jgi:hypothetical protein